MLDVTVLDAVIAGLSTAFFGALVAGGAYLLLQHLTLRDQVANLTARLDRLAAVEAFASRLGVRGSEGETLKPSGTNDRGDARAR